MNPRSFPRFQVQGRQGVALVLVLCFLLLLTGLVVAFLTRAMTQRQVADTNASGTKAELLAGTAMDNIADDLRQEVISKSTISGSGTTAIYVPLSATNAVPARQAFTPSSLANLIRISSRLDPGTRAGSAASTAPSLNGRSVNLARWNLHYLLPLKTASATDDSTPSSNFTAPDWVVVTRSGTAAGTTWSKTLADPSASNGNYAIGRYAYAIYDEGGLLDINAAGYPSNATAAQYGPKGGLAYADLTQLTGSSGNALLTKTQVDQIVGWRNYASARPAGSFRGFTFDSAAASRYQSFVTSGSRDFLSFSGSATYNGNTDHGILNRQQLIKLFEGIASTSTEQANFKNALQSIGTFSREVNGGTWGPSADYTSPYNYKTIQFSGTSTNSFILANKVPLQGGFTRADGTQAVPGEPLVKNRFPLEKLALLEKLKSVSALTTQDVDDIARYFGLDPVSDSNGFYRHWKYPTTNPKYPHPNTSVPTIMSLSEVAVQNREPDFFELLQAGILNGSLGRWKTANGYCRGDLIVWSSTVPALADPDDKVTLQILRIGANIIDQWDSDSYPTTISFTSTALTNDVCGIEDLPYINEFLFRNSGPGTLVDPTQKNDFSICFELWNPHQALTTNTGTYPTTFRISPLNSGTIKTTNDYYRSGFLLTAGTNGKAYWFYDTSANAWKSGQGTLTNSCRYFATDSENNGIIPFSLTNPATDFREPTLSGSIKLNSLTGYPPDNVPSPSTSGSNWVWSQWAQKTGVTAAMFLNFSMVWRIEFQDSQSKFHTYSTFVGLDNPDAPSGYKENGWLYFKDSATPTWYSFVKPDPRTSRLGAAGSKIMSGVWKAASLTPNATTLNSPIITLPPFTWNDQSGVYYRMDWWAVNDSSKGPPDTNFTYPSYPDNDGQIRPGDARYSVSPLFDNTNGGPAARPVILNRAFRSVGELGYAFRDMPWKSLDFFSSTSADAALLDLFSLSSSQSLLAGRLNPNTRNVGALTAVLAGATQASGGNGTNLSSANAAKVASALIALSGTTPFTNRAELVTRLMNDPAIASVSNIKTEREAVIRALADCSNTRTWNLLIDLVAQVGRYPSTTSSLDQFLVEGERHYWLHVAIDRYTGRIIDQQRELLRE